MTDEYTNNKYTMSFGGNLLNLIVLRMSTLKCFLLDDNGHVPSLCLSTEKYTVQRFFLYETSHWFSHDR